MAELLTLEATTEVLEKFRLAWRTRITEKDLLPTAQTFHEALSGLTVESVRTAAKRLIQSNQHFPAVKELRELALDFMARTQLAMPVRRADSLTCPICGAKPEPVIITRPRRNPREQYRVILDLENNPVMETVDTGRTETYHDRAAHHVVDSLTA